VQPYVIMQSKQEADISLSLALIESRSCGSSKSCGYVPVNRPVFESVSRLVF